MVHCEPGQLALAVLCLFLELAHAFGELGNRTVPALGQLCELALAACGDLRDIAFAALEQLGQLSPAALGELGQLALAALGLLRELAFVLGECRLSGGELRPLLFELGEEGRFARISRRLGRRVNS